MNHLLSKSKRRFLVVFNFSSVIVFIALVLFGEYTSWDVVLTVAAILSFILIVLSFVFLYIRTGLWKLTHTKTESLDEREIQLTHQSLRQSYKIFSLISLVILFFIVISVRYSFFTLTHRGHYSFGLIILMFLNYLVNTLPAAVIAWTEPEVRTSS
jgi:ABC-type Fe3+ transport system permease subunit